MKEVLLSFLLISSTSTSGLNTIGVRKLVIFVHSVRVTIRAWKIAQVIFKGT